MNFPVLPNSKGKCRCFPIYPPLISAGYFTLIISYWTETRAQRNSTDFLVYGLEKQASWVIHKPSFRGIRVGEPQLSEIKGEEGLVGTLKIQAQLGFFPSQRC